MYTNGTASLSGLRTPRVPSSDSWICVKKRSWWDLFSLFGRHHCFFLKLPRNISKTPGKFFLYCALTPSSDQEKTEAQGPGTLKGGWNCRVRHSLDETSDWACVSLSRFSKELIIFTDASYYGAGSVQSQMHNVTDKPMAYVSRNFNRAESNYLTIEKEVTAIIFGIYLFKHYLQNNLIVIISDHHLCQY